MRTWDTVPLALAGLALGLAPGTARADFVSTFDAGLDGWTGAGGAVAFVAAGGNPGGYLRQTDTVGDYMTVFAPPAFGGDRSAFLGGTLSFDARLAGGEGDDWLYGQGGWDTVYGGAGNDWLFGGAGRDGLFGGAGFNLVDGGADPDRLLSTGTDFYWYGVAAEDAVVQFRTGTNISNSFGLYPPKGWTDAEVERVDVSLAALHRFGPGARLLKYPDGGVVTFYR